MKITLPQERTIVQYYSKDDGLLCKTEKSQDTPQGSVSVIIEFGEYRAIGGVLLPHRIIQSAGPQKISLTVEEIDIDTIIPI